MRTALTLLMVVVPLCVYGGERCIAIDGDTLVCNHQKVRLTNVYAAELNEPGGWAATRRLQTMISAGEVSLHPYGQDRYGRTLAEVYVNGRRIEQSDIGPRAGRGSRLAGRSASTDSYSKSPISEEPAPRARALKNIPAIFAFSGPFVGSRRRKKLQCRNTDLSSNSRVAEPNKSRYSPSARLVPSGRKTKKTAVKTRTRKRFGRTGWRGACSRRTSRRGDSCQRLIGRFFLGTSQI